MTTIPLLNPAHTVLDLAARVAAFFISAPSRLAQPADDEIAHYATQTYRHGVLVASTPEITYGQLRRG